jgi:hypothetical protein
MTSRAQSGTGGGARRGSALILIIGTLALISVITVAYVLVGRSDRRTGAAVEHRSEVSDAADRVITYLARDVIGADVLAVHAEGEDSAGRIIFTREAWDYPSTLPQARSLSKNSSPALSGNQVRFSPAGDIRADYDPATGALFGGSDPFLASLEPTWLPSDAGEGDDAPDPTTPYDRNVDWAHISNVAPDGRFVSLYNLAPLVGGRRVPNFDVEPGTGSDSKGLPRLSQGLWLLEPGKPNTRVTGQNDLGVSLDLNIPWLWDSRQRGAFRPARDVTYTPGEPQHLLHQWADADGDGMVDSRWQALVDSTDPDDVWEAISRTGRYRWFIAARVIDLSGLVNVNTATGFEGAAGVNPDDPGATYRLGNLPSDVDLLRLLRLDDPQDELGRTYSGLKQPGPWGYSTQLDYSGYDDSVRREVGNWAYRNLRHSIATSIVLPRNKLPVAGDATIDLSAGGRFEHYIVRGGRYDSANYLAQGAGVYLAGSAFAIDDLVELMTYRGLNNPDVTSRLEAVTGGRAAGSPRYSPLRDNLPLGLERDLDDSDNNGLPDIEALHRFAVDPRQRLTTVSGARPLVSGRVDIVDPSTGKIDWKNPDSPVNRLGISELRIDAIAALEQATSSGTRDPSLLFAGIADALLPFSDDPDAWNIASPSTHLSYGGSAERALRAAAHMTASLIDSYDTDSEITGLTLRINADFDPATDPVAYPWWNVGVPGRLDLNAALGLPSTGPTSRLAANTDSASVQSDAINVFGVEVQPFLTEVATFVMYVDAPEGAGGDDDYADDPDTPEIEVAPVTIDGNVSETNADFLMQAVAFQLTNVFEESIDLTDYYVEFGGSVDGTSTHAYSLSGTLPAESSLVFYALSQPVADIAARMTLADGSVNQAHADGWISAQFGAAAVRIDRFDPRTRQPITGFVDLLAGSAGATDATASANRTAKLWRLPPAGAGGPGLGQAAFDKRILVDRLRDRAPGTVRPTLDRRMDSGNQDIVGTDGGSKSGDPRDNAEGIAVTLWASVRRPDDPGETNGFGIPLGAIPAFCIESKYTYASAAPGSARGYNLLDSDNVGALPPRCQDFNNTVGCGGGFGKPGGPAGEFSLFDLMTSQGGAKVLSDTLKVDADAGSTPSGTIPMNIQGPISGQSAFENLRTELRVHNDRFDPDNAVFIKGVSYPLKTLRVTDLLGAMAIGPCRDPFDPLAVASGDPDDQWLTLSEALALALHYDDTNPGEIAGAPVSGAHVLDDAHLYLSRGALHVDRFVPFIDHNGNGVVDPDEFERRAGSLPLALGILERFSAYDPGFGSLTRPTMGVINVNTASLPVMRCLPLLSPTADSIAWWTTPQHDIDCDVAATIIAYRDKTAVWTARTPSAPLNFLDDADGQKPFDYLDPLDARANGRAFASGVDGIREQPGLGAVGELQAARDLQYPSQGALGSDNPHDIDRLGRDGVSINEPGIEGVLYDGNGDGVRASPDGVIDDIDETLALTGAILNSASVRSDYFGVWFVLHGYQRSDLEGLGSDDPILPSIARRYFMVVDRSTVVRRGDMPRILVLRELSVR